MSNLTAFLLGFGSAYAFSAAAMAAILWISRAAHLGGNQYLARL